MSTPGRASEAPGAADAAHPYLVQIDGERQGWYELTRLVQSLTPDEWLIPGYYHDPDWTVRDLFAHVGTWLAEAHAQLERIVAGTYEGHDVEIDAMNAALLRGMEGQPCDVAWVQGQSARAQMVAGWNSLSRPSDEAAWWIRKAGADHYAEHLGRLREWSGELIARRTGAAGKMAQADERAL
jgi:hypothetical protein